MKLKTKLTFWSTGAILLIAIVAFVAWINFKKMHKTTDYVFHTSQVIQQALILEKYIERLEINIRNCTLFKNQQYFEVYIKDKQYLFSRIKKLLEFVKTPAQKEVIESVRTRVVKWTDEADKFIQQLRTDSKESVVQDIVKMKLGDKYLDYIRKDVRSFYNNEQALMGKRKLNETFELDYTFIILESTTLMIIVLFALFSYILSTQIRNPIKKTTLMMQEIAEGNADLTKRLTITNKDEVGELAHLFNLFIENLQKMIIEMKQKSDILDKYSDVLLKTSTTLANESVANSSAVDHMNSAMEDLTQISEANNKEITESLINTKEKIRKLITLIDPIESKGEMLSINDYLKDISEVISDITDKTSLIEDFIKAIKEISIQSRILAVNASIQANKAGEYGKGFSVIASEIKSLSVNSDKSIKNVLKIFKEVNSLSQRCSLSIDKIDNILNEFLDKCRRHNFEMEENAGILAEISVTIDELTVSRSSQLEGIKILSGAMESIKDSSSNNADGARNLEEASGEIAEISNKMKNNIDNFKT